MQETEKNADNKSDGGVSIGQRDSPINLSFIEQFKNRVEEAAQDTRAMQSSPATSPEGVPPSHQVVAATSVECFGSPIRGSRGLAWLADGAVLVG